MVLGQNYYNLGYDSMCQYIYTKPNTKNVVFPYNITYSKNEDNAFAIMTDKTHFEFYFRDQY